MGGPRRKEGDTVVSANGYSYTYVKKGNTLHRVLTHWVLGEQKYHRPPAADERVRFKDGDRTNLKPSNIIYVKKNTGLAALNKRRMAILTRIQELKVELEEVEELIEKRTNSNGH